MAVTINGTKRERKYRDHGGNFRIEVCWSTEESDSETGKFYCERWLSNKVELDDGEYLSERSDITDSVISEAIETILDETAHDDAEFEWAEVFERTEIRRIE